MRSKNVLNYSEFLLTLCGISSSMFLSKSSYDVLDASSHFSSELKEVIHNIILKAHPEIKDEPQSRKQDGEIQARPLYTGLIHLSEELKSHLSTFDFDPVNKFSPLISSFPEYDLEPLNNFLERVSPRIYEAIKECLPKKNCQNWFDNYKKYWGGGELGDRKRPLENVSLSPSREENSPQEADHTKFDYSSEDLDELYPLKKRKVPPIKNIAYEAEMSSPSNPEDEAPSLSHQRFFSASTFRGNILEGSVMRVRNFPLQIVLGLISPESTKREYLIAIGNSTLTLSDKELRFHVEIPMDDRGNTYFRVADHDFVLSFTGKAYDKKPCIRLAQSSAFFQPTVFQFRVIPKQAICSIRTHLGPFKVIAIPTAYKKFEFRLKKDENDTRECNFKTISDDHFSIGDRLYQAIEGPQAVIKIRGVKRCVNRIALINTNALISGFNFSRTSSGQTPLSVCINLELLQKLKQRAYDGFMLYTTHVPETFANLLLKNLQGSPLECVPFLRHSDLLLTKNLIPWLIDELGINCLGVCTPKDVFTRESPISSQLNAQIEYFEQEIEDTPSVRIFTETYLSELVQKYQALPDVSTKIHRTPERCAVRKLISHLAHIDNTSLYCMDVYEVSPTVCESLMEFELRKQDKMQVFHTEKSEITLVEPRKNSHSIRPGISGP